MACIFEMIGIACFVAVLLSLSSKAPYQLKMAIYFTGFCTIVMIFLPFMLFRPKDYRNALIPAKAFIYLCRVLGVEMEVRGLENVRVEHGSVIIINHQSALDLLGCCYLWPVIGRVTVVMKREILLLPFFGVGAWLWGSLFINRSRKNDSIKSLIKGSRAINDRNSKLIFFPEGTRNSSDTLLPFKKGAFHIALDINCPIQPVVVSKYWFLNSEKKIFRPGRAIIHILPEISTKGMTRDNIDELIYKCKDTMQTEYFTLSQETKYHNTNKQA